MDGALGRRVPALSQAAGGFFGGRLAWVHWGGGAGGLGRAGSWTQPTPSAPAEGHVPRAVAPFLHQWLVKLSAGS